MKYILNNNIVESGTGYIIVDGKTIINPTEQQLTELGYTLYEPPTTVITTPDYETLVQTKIRATYTLEQELAIQRQRDEKPEEFADYYTYCEACKTAAQDEIEAFNNDINTSTSEQE